MKNLIYIFGLAALLVVYTCGLVLATPVLYDGGPADYRTGSSVADIHGTAKSFMLDTDSVVSKVNFFAWTYRESPITLNWAITTIPFGGITEASGTASTSYNISTYNNSLPLISNYSCMTSIYNFGIASFSIPAVMLSGGTHYLQLSNAETTHDNSTEQPFLLWDINNGPAGAYIYDSFNSTNVYFDFAPTFQIIGTPVPESGTLLLFFIGLIVFVFIRKKA